MNSHKAVILGTNYYIGLSVIRCLGKMGIHTVGMNHSDINNYGAKSKYLNEMLISPHYEDEVAFITYLVAYGQAQTEKPVLFPCHDSYVALIDRHIKAIEPYFLTVQDERQLSSILMDKGTLYEAAKGYNVLLPETLYPDSEDLINQVATQLGYPCMVKPTDSVKFVQAFRTKSFIVKDAEELVAAIKKAQDKQLEVIIQRIIPGFDDHMVTFNFYLNHKSILTHYTTCQKYRQYPINFGASVYIKQTPINELLSISQPFLEGLGYKGVGEIEFKKDAVTCRYYLIEINVRTTNFNAMLEHIGLNFPLIQYQELTGNPIENHHIMTETGVFFRYFYEDCFAIRDYLKTKQLGLKVILLSLCNKKVSAIFSWSDPTPSFYFIGRIFRKVIKHLRE